MDDLDEAVRVLDEGARSAGARLHSSQDALGALTRIAGLFKTSIGDEAANMGALVVINAMMFQERMSGFNPEVRPLSGLRHGGHIVNKRLQETWDAILDVNYYPIFRIARNLVQELPAHLAADFLSQCAGTAELLLGMAATRRHDLAGRIFNRLIADRKFLAAFYTRIPAATLLAGLALEPSKWPDMDWGDSEAVRRLRVVDPACGTGTLLMAAYHQITQNFRRAWRPRTDEEHVDEAALHRLMIEEVIYGADVVQAGIHLTAATLALMAPSVSFKRMKLYTLKLGVYPLAGVRLGSLDWLERDSPGNLVFRWR